MTKAVGKALFVPGMLAASFAGGACFQWLSAGAVARASAQTAEPPREVRANSVVVVDASGAERARLGPVTASGGSPAKRSGALTGLVLRDEAGVVRAVLATGAKSGAGFNLLGPEGKQRIAIGSDGESAGVSLFAADGAERCSLGATEDGKDAGVELSGGVGGSRIGIGLGPEGCGIRLVDTKGKERCGIGVNPKSGPGIYLADADGKTTWHAP